MAVHVADVAAALGFGVELVGELIGRRSLAVPVVTGRAGSDRSHRTEVDAGGDIVLDAHRRDGVEEHQLVDEARVAVHEIDRCGTTDVAADDAARPVAEEVVDEQVHVAAVGGEVVHIVGGQVRVPEATEVRHDHLVAGGDEGVDVAPPDPLRLRVPVEQQQRVPADTLADVGDRQPVASRCRRHRPAMDRVGVGGRDRWLRGAETEVVVHAPTVRSGSPVAGTDRTRSSERPQIAVSLVGGIAVHTDQGFRSDVDVDESAGAPVLAGDPVHEALVEVVHAATVPTSNHVSCSRFATVRSPICCRNGRWRVRGVR